jgi:hypothetical protein
MTTTLPAGHPRSLALFTKSYCRSVAHYYPERRPLVFGGEAVAKKLATPQGAMAGWLLCLAVAQGHDHFESAALEPSGDWS